MEVISNQSKVRNCNENAAENFQPKYGASQRNVAFATSYENGELRLKLSFLVIILGKKPRTGLLIRN